MANSHEQHDDLIDLGTASEVIQGILPGNADEFAGQNPAGLSDD